MTLLLVIVVLSLIGFVTFVAANLTDPQETTGPHQEPGARRWN